MEPSITLRCRAGPDAGWTRRLTPGRYWLGRAPGDLRVADPALEAHHALVTVSASGDVALLQTSGRSPLCVDGVAIDGRTVLGRSSVIEVGCSRLELVDAGLFEVGAAVTHTGAVFAPLDDSVDELARFERDLERMTPALRRAQVDDHRAGALEVGVVSHVLQPTVLDRTGTSLPESHWPHPVTAAIERHLRHDVPLRIRLDRGRSVAIVGPHRDAIVAHLLDQLGSTRRATALVLDPAGADDFAHVVEHVDRPIIVGCATLDEVPSWCRSILEIGSTWRGTWRPDVVDDPTTILRAHAAARTTSRFRSSHGAVVAEEVASAGAEVGGRVVGVPESARGQRQAPAADAFVELIAKAGQDGHLFVETRSPRAREFGPILRGRGPPVGE